MPQGVAVGLALHDDDLACSASTVEAIQAVERGFRTFLPTKAVVAIESEPKPYRGVQAKPPQERNRESFRGRVVVDGQPLVRAVRVFE
jgi:hypothetical protein